MRRAWGVGLALALLLAPGAAQAHGGDLVYAGTSGPYQIRAFAVWADGELDYSIDLRDLTTGARVTGARVTVTVFENGAPIGTYAAAEVEGLYDVIEPAPERIHWDLALDIAGALGPASAAHRLDLEPNDWLWPSVVILGGFVAAVAAHAVTARRRARRAAAPPSR